MISISRASISQRRGQMWMQEQPYVWVRGRVRDA